jgi:UDP-N-acetylmuramate--alanine ligase
LPLYGKPVRAHLVGIGGSGMTALAELLLGLGWRVSGSDCQEFAAAERLRTQGAQVWLGHAAEQISRDTDVVVYSAAVGPGNCERQAAERRGLAQLSYTQMLGQLMRPRRGIGIAGTHGKSTTTAMTAVILAEAGLDPVAVVGAELPQWNGSARAGRGEWFVVECCEYQRNFLDVAPQAAAILNVEADHLDCYRDLDEIVEAFGQYAGRVPASGVVVARGHSEHVTRAVAGADAEVQTFSLEPGADWWAADLRERQGRFEFRVFHEGAFVTQVQLQVPGRHNVANALAAAALGYWVGARPVQIREALAGFRGLRRRMEVVGSWRGVTLVSDYGHHPTEIRATLATARQMFGRRRLWCVFQPHQLSRTRALFEQFAESFDKVDRLLVSDVYNAREESDGAHRSEALRLAEAVARRGIEAHPGHTLDQVVTLLEGELQPGDVLIAIGAGDVGKVCDAFARRLQRHRRAG